MSVLCRGDRQDVGQRAGRRGTIHTNAAAGLMRCATGLECGTVEGRQVADRPEAGEAEGASEARGRGCRNAGRRRGHDANTVS